MDMFPTVGTSSSSSSSESDPPPPPPPLAPLCEAEPSPSETLSPPLEPDDSFSLSFFFFCWGDKGMNGVER